MTFVDGDVFFDRERDLARRPQLEQERKTLEQAEANKPPARGEGATPPRPPAAIRRAYTHDDDVHYEEDNQR
jgi:hypothetical protein